MSGRRCTNSQSVSCHLNVFVLLNSRSRKKMQGVANVSFLAMFLMYLLAALFGYLTFNSEQPWGGRGMLAL